MADPCEHRWVSIKDDDTVIVVCRDCKKTPYDVPGAITTCPQCMGMGCTTCLNTGR